MQERHGAVNLKACWANWEGIKRSGLMLFFIITGVLTGTREFAIMYKVLIWCAEAGAKSLMTDLVFMFIFSPL